MIKIYQSERYKIIERLKLLFNVNETQLMIFTTRELKKMYKGLI